MREKLRTKQSEFYFRFNKNSSFFYTRLKLDSKDLLTHRIEEVSLFFFLS